MLVVCRFHERQKQLAVFERFEATRIRPTRVRRGEQAGYRDHAEALASQPEHEVMQLVAQGLTTRGSPSGSSSGRPPANFPLSRVLLRVAAGGRARLVLIGYESGLKARSTGDQA